MRGVPMGVVEAQPRAQRLLAWRKRTLRPPRAIQCRGYDQRRLSNPRNYERL